MSDKKHIDRLFQERFKYFEATPRDTVWENIEAELNNNKKKRRVIPIWWRYAGVAAVLLLLITVGNFVVNNNANKSQDIKVVDTESDNNSRLKLNKEKASGIIEENEPIITNNNENTTHDNLNKGEGVVADNNAGNGDEVKDLLHNDKSDKINNSKQQIIITNNNANATHNNVNKYEAVALDNNTIKNDQVKTPSYNNRSSKINNTEETIGIAKTTTPNKNNVATNLSLNKQEKSSNLILKDEVKVAIASNPKVDNKNKESIKNEDGESLIGSNKTENSTSDLQKNTAVAKNEDSIEVNSGIEVIANAENIKENKLTIEEALEKSNEIAQEETKLSRWSITPNAAPVYFNGINEEGSSFDSQFDNNSKSGEVNMSYGISTSYAINKKISIRSGINKMNLGYSTNEVVISQSLTSSNSSTLLSNVDVAESSQSDVLTSVNTNENISIISGADLNNAESFETNNSSINQSFGYIEVPLEIQYTLSDKKLGINVIGGVSSLFLNDSKVFTETNGTRTFLGEANNINKVSYSANFGLGVNYQMSKNIGLNLEPIFKYQINTFNNTSGEFKPYILGVYTGFAIKF